MTQGALEIVEGNQKLETLPLQVTQRFSRTSAMARLAMLVPAVLLVLVPVSFLSASSDALTQAAAHPGDAMMAGVGVIIFVALFGMPLSWALKALVSQRSVRIEAGTITVEDRGLLGVRTWTLPLTSYTGLAHVVRTSLSGARHELVLVHALRNRRVLICASDKLSDSDLAHASRLLSLPLVPANDLYRWPVARVEPTSEPTAFPRAA